MAGWRCRRGWTDGKGGVEFGMARERENWGNSAWILLTRGDLALSHANACAHVSPPLAFNPSAVHVLCMCMLTGEKKI